jgi:predicted membrane chloride channel (bestrophin family)
VLDDDDVTLNGALCFPSTTGHAIVGSILGFLLVFRTNISYTRFFEGRSNLGGMMNFIRDMSMILEVHCFTNDDEGQQRRFDCRRKINLAYGFVRQTLRESRHGFRPKVISLSLPFPPSLLT